MTPPPPQHNKNRLQADLYGAGGPKRVPTQPPIQQRSVPGNVPNPATIKAQPRPGMPPTDSLKRPREGDVAGQDPKRQRTGNFLFKGITTVLEGVVNGALLVVKFNKAICTGTFGIVKKTFSVFKIF
ncbi:hypothetical protein BdWA1_000598 [Babesia duncani]|uniref:Uncharacterized protein n=1 Tax=Babesia duncani TaxID=323732 RepID=A0AAD9PMG3_9APIC|nr:hypothetical protein BdWA1_000598 [Babesia duncani]